MSGLHKYHYLLGERNANNITTAVIINNKYHLEETKTKKWPAKWTPTTSFIHFSRRNRTTLAVRRSECPRWNIVLNWTFLPHAPYSLCWRFPFTIFPIWDFASLNLFLHVSNKRFIFARIARIQCYASFEWAEINFASSIISVRAYSCVWTLEIENSWWKFMSSEVLMSHQENRPVKIGSPEFNMQ